MYASQAAGRSYRRNCSADITCRTGMQDRQNKLPCGAAMGSRTEWGEPDVAEFVGRGADWQNDRPPGGFSCWRTLGAERSLRWFCGLSNWGRAGCCMARCRGSLQPATQHARVAGQHIQIMLVQGMYSGVMQGCKCPIGRCHAHHSSGCWECAAHSGPTRQRTFNNRFSTTLSI
jgi:hypothetical protein